MLTINCQNVKKYNGAQLVLENVTFELHHGEKAGLVGRNGSGKSTLLRMVSKLDVPDEGLLTVRKDARIGYLEQIPTEGPERTVYDALALGYSELFACRTEMTEIERLVGALKRLGGHAQGMVKAESWHKIAVTKDIELSVRAEFGPDQLAVFRELALILRDFLRRTELPDERDE